MADVTITIKTIDQTQKGTKKAGDNFKDLLGTVTKLGAGFAAAGFAAKKTFDVLESGAAVAQTEESFGLLLQTVGAAPDLLRRLEDASGDTISEMQLMTSTATLLAGAEDELASSLANATPELLSIAKAANKLNPALGSVDDQYRSIATGIKRASPLILDNLGLTIKVGEANERYAETLGKSASELTAVEQKQALLEETLRAGKVLIDQVGGSTESMTDAYQQFAKESTDAWNEFKAEAGETFEPFIQWVADGMKETNDFRDALNALGMDDSLAELGGRAEKYLGMTREEFIEMANTITSEAQGADTAMLGIVQRFRDTDVAASGAKGSVEALGGAWEDYTTKAIAAQVLTETWGRAAEDNLITDEEAEQIRGLGMAFGESGEELGQAIDNFNAVGDALRQGKDPLEAMERAALGLNEELPTMNSQVAKSGVPDDVISSWQEYVDLLNAAGMGGGTRDFARPPGSGNLPGPGGQHGLDFIVPPGYPNDTYPVRASSGEQVKIIPEGQSSGKSVNIYGGIHFGDSGSRGVFDELSRELRRL